MPFLEIEVVIDDGESLPRNMAKDIADHAGKVFNSPPGHTWVRLQTLLRSDYAENDLGTNLRIRPVFVSVLKSHQHEPEEMASEMLLLTKIISKVCDRPVENVHILYLPAAIGRISFGGVFLQETSIGTDRDEL